MRILNDAEKTEVLYGTENIISRQMLAFPDLREKVDAYFDHTGPSALVTCEPIWNAIKVLVKRDIKLRYITDITKENIAYCKQMIEYFELRHLNGAKGNFGIADGIDCIIHSVLEKEQAPMQAILTNVKSFVEAQQYLFDTLWIKAIPAEQRFRVIEEGLEADFIKTIRDPYKVQSLGFDLVRQAREEILTIFSTANAFQRQVRSGAVKSLMEAAYLGGVKVRILTPFNEKINQLIEEWKSKDGSSGDESKDDSSSGSADADKTMDQPFDIDRLKIRFIEPQLQTKVSILVVDRKYSLSVEVKDDTKDNSYEAMGLTSYSNSKSTVLSYVSIFESLWSQLDLYEQLKESNKQQMLLVERLKVHDSLQKEFISMAAHELRTPIQPILGLADILGSKKGNIEQYQDVISTISRSARRLKLLADDILDVSRIDGKSFELRHDTFDLVTTINSLLDGYRKDHKRLMKESEISFECSFKNALVFGDRQRIHQVLQNLLDNALNFTKHGFIIVSLLEKKTENAKEWNVTIKDEGEGIDSEIIPRLFTKFATKSLHGIGLGLYISKSIIEAHGGRIWAENNADGKGATFSFSLPMIS